MLYAIGYILILGTIQIIEHVSKIQRQMLCPEVSYICTEGFVLPQELGYIT